MDFTRRGFFLSLVSFALPLRRPRPEPPLEWLTCPTGRIRRIRAARSWIGRQGPWSGVTVPTSMVRCWKLAQMPRRSA